MQDVLGIVEKYNKQYRTADVLFNCEMIPAENVGVKHAKWDREDGYVVPRDCYNSYFYAVEDPSLNVLDELRRRPDRRLGPAHESRRASVESAVPPAAVASLPARNNSSRSTSRTPDCNDCGHIDKRYLKECPICRQPRHGLSDARDRLPEAREQLLEAASRRGRRTPLQTSAAAETETAPAAVTETTPTSC